jgi:hypothetical protein
MTTASTPVTNPNVTRSRMAREALDPPQCMPLLPAAERFWKSRGYL